MAELAESVGPHEVYSILAKWTSSLDYILKNDEVEIRKSTEIWVYEMIYRERERKRERERERERERKEWKKNWRECMCVKDEKNECAISHATATTTTTLSRLCYFAADLIVYCHVLL